MHKILLLEKYEAVGFKYDKTFFKILAQKLMFMFVNIDQEVFLVQNLGIFIQTWNFEIKQIWGWWFQLWQKYFQIATQKYLNKEMLVLDLTTFIFPQNFEAGDFKCDNGFLSFRLKIPK